MTDPKTAPDYPELMERCAKNVTAVLNEYPQLSPAMQAGILQMELLAIARRAQEIKEKEAAK